MKGIKCLFVVLLVFLMVGCQKNVPDSSFQGTFQIKDDSQGKDYNGLSIAVRILGDENKFYLSANGSEFVDGVIEGSLEKISNEEIRLRFADKNDPLLIKTDSGLVMVFMEDGEMKSLSMPKVSNDIITSRTEDEPYTTIKK